MASDPAVREVGDRMVADLTWIGRATLDEGREASLFLDGSLGALPSCSTHAVLGVEAHDGGRTLVMRDVGDRLRSPRDPASLTEVSAWLSAAREIAERFGACLPRGLATTAQRITLFSPRVVRANTPFDDYPPKVGQRAWQVWAQEAPTDVVATAAAVQNAPSFVADAIDAAGRVFLHGDINGRNVGDDDGRVLFIDWGEATAAPPALDVAWLAYFLPSMCLAHDEVLETFREVWGGSHDEATLRLALFGIGTTVACGIALDVIDAIDSETVDATRSELAWWCEQIRDGAHDLGLL